MENKSWHAVNYLTQVTLNKRFPTILAQTRQTKKFGDDPDFETALQIAQKYLKRPEEIEQLPEAWDWSNVEGTDFVGPVLDQGGCGSCYTFSIVQALESRLRIWFGFDERLSVQFPLQCNFLTEGCNGGHSFLVGQFFEHFWATTEECAEYQTTTTADSCQDFADCPKVAKAENIRYVGGHYAGMSEDDIMRELRANGPLSVDFDAGVTEFFIYEKGIMT